MRLDCADDCDCRWIPERSTSTITMSVLVDYCVIFSQKGDLCSYLAFFLLRLYIIMFHSRSDSTAPFIYMQVVFVRGTVCSMPCHAKCGTSCC